LCGEVDWTKRIILKRDWGETRRGEQRRAEERRAEERSQTEKGSTVGKVVSTECSSSREREDGIRWDDSRRRNGRRRFLFCPEERRTKQRTILCRA
jgi:hypothetical protein